MIRAELNQSRLRGRQKLSDRQVAKVLEACAHVLHVRGTYRVSIAFVSSVSMRKLNRQWRGKDRTTDVLSFTLDDGFLKGEILLNYAQAKRQARQKGQRVGDELCFLIVHGMLHLWGYNHENLQDATEMFPLQEKICRFLNIDPHV